MGIFEFYRSIKKFKLENIKKESHLPIAIIIGSIIIAGAIYYSSTSEYRNARKACTYMMLSDGSVSKKDLKTNPIWEDVIIPACISDKLFGNK